MFVPEYSVFSNIRSKTPEFDSKLLACIYMYFTRNIQEIYKICGVWFSFVAVSLSVNCRSMRIVYILRRLYTWPTWPCVCDATLKDTSKINWNRSITKTNNNKKHGTFILCSGCPLLRQCLYWSVGTVLLGLSDVPVNEYNGIYKAGLSRLTHLPLDKMGTKWPLFRRQYFHMPFR